MINSSKVIFIKQRPQPRPSHMAVTCEDCGRQLHDSRFCSLRCKLEIEGLAPFRDGTRPSRLVVCGKQSKRSLRPETLHQPPTPDSVEAPDTPSNSEPDVDQLLDLTIDDVESQRRLSVISPAPNQSLRNGNLRKRRKPQRSPLQ
jgi:hypothetical protein